MNCPLLKHGHDYISTPRYPVVLKRDVHTGLDLDSRFCFAFLSGDTLLGYQVEGELVICNGYACDGYSPVIKIFNHHIRLTPTPKCGMFPSILHDFLRQFSDVEQSPCDRFDADDYFRDALIAGGCPSSAQIYHTAVAGPVGSAYLFLTRRRDKKLRIIRHSNHHENTTREIHAMVQRAKIR